MSFVTHMLGECWLFFLEGEWFGLRGDGGAGGAHSGPHISGTRAAV